MYADSGSRDQDGFGQAFVPVHKAVEHLRTLGQRKALPQAGQAGAALGNGLQADRVLPGGGIAELHIDLLGDAALQREVDGPGVAAAYADLCALTFCCIYYSAMLPSSCLQTGFFQLCGVWPSSSTRALFTSTPRPGFWGRLTKPFTNLKSSGFSA